MGSNYNYQFSGYGGLLFGLIVLTVVVALPMKIGARLVNAKYTGIIRCGFAAFVGLLGGVLAAALLGGLIGPLLGFALGYLLAIRAMLGTTLLGAIGLTVVAVLISMLGCWLLAKLGIFVAGPMTTTTVTSTTT
jgi:hypothetical protein